jgi:hypothetical protein
MVHAKKDGKSRFVITDLAQNDTFTVKPGYYIVSVIAEQIGATFSANTLSISTTPAVNQLGKFTVAGTASAASTVFTIGGVAAVTQIAINSTMATTVLKIWNEFGPGGAKAAELAATAGIVLTDYSTTTGIINWKSNPANTSDLPAIVTTSLATQTVTRTNLTTGVLPVDVMARTTMGAYAAHSLKNYTSAVVTGGKWGVASSGTARTYYVHSDLIGLGNTNVYVQIEKMD